MSKQLIKRIMIDAEMGRYRASREVRSSKWVGYEMYITKKDDTSEVWEVQNNCWQLVKTCTAAESIAHLLA